MNTTYKLIVFLCVAAAATACVSTKKYSQLNARLMRVEDQYAKTQNLAGNLQAELKQAKVDNNEVSAKYQKLQEDYRLLLADNSTEVSRMLTELEKNQRMLAEREKNLSELENSLRSRDSVLSEIRQKVASALLGFEGKGLSVTQRGSNVYVSMEDKLLFHSGSFEIDPQGAQAVRELGKVLAQNPDINVVVEGHTDDVPFKGTGLLKDNLDLSVKRATTVTRLLLENKEIDPARITSAGRGEYLPLMSGNTPEARQMNRRTDIILTPKIAELLKIME